MRRSTSFFRTPLQQFTFGCGKLQLPSCFVPETILLYGLVEYLLALPPFSGGPVVIVFFWRVVPPFIGPQHDLPSEADLLSLFVATRSSFFFLVWPVSAVYSTRTTLSVISLVQGPVALAYRVNKQAYVYTHRCAYAHLAVELGWLSPEVFGVVVDEGRTSFELLSR